MSTRQLQPGKYMVQVIIIEVAGYILMCIQTDVECGMKLCVKIPQIPDAYLQDLKDDIKQVGLALLRC